MVARLFPSHAHNRRSSHPVQPNFHVIAGRGAHIAVQTGRDGAIVVDSAPEHAARRDRGDPKLTREPIRYLINQRNPITWAATTPGRPRAVRDPTGASTRSARLEPRTHPGRGARAVGDDGAHGGEVGVPGWRVAHGTFSAALDEIQKDLFFNGEAIVVTYQPSAHSDGDSVVFFRKSDVIVAGELFDMTRFPVINRAAGGSLQGVIDALNRIIVTAVAPVPLVWQEGGTLIVPARGPLAHEADVVDYRD